MTRQRRPLACSFCGRDETEVAKLVAGPKVYICDRCVAAARWIMERADEEPPQPQVPLGRRRISGWIRRYWPGVGRRSLKCHAASA